MLAMYVLASPMLPRMFCDGSPLLACYVLRPTEKNFRSLLRCELVRPVPWRAFRRREHTHCHRGRGFGTVTFSVVKGGRRGRRGISQFPTQLNVTGRRSAFLWRERIFRIALRATGPLVSPGSEFGAPETDCRIDFAHR